ncbi:NUDIX domain-containing protein [Paenarthrobacter nitroguajacolicus]
MEGSPPNRTVRGGAEELQSTATDDDSSEDHTPVPVGRVLVAVVLEWQHKIALFRRSSNLDHDVGRWHCVTGFLEPGATPRQQALQELAEETGLIGHDVVELRAGPCLTLDDTTGAPWLVHTFTALSVRRRLQINWEHDAYRWTSPSKVRRFSNQVSWLEPVLRATGHSTSETTRATTELKSQYREGIAT